MVNTEEMNLLYEGGSVIAYEQTCLPVGKSIQLVTAKLTK